MLADWVQQTWDLGSVVDVKRINLSENAMYRVTTEQKQAFVLRLSQPGYQTDHSILAELTWLQHLAKTGKIFWSKPPMSSLPEQELYCSNFPVILLGDVRFFPY